MGLRTLGIKTWIAGVGLAVVAAVLPPIGAAAPAHAENNGVGLTPALGWSSWSSVRKDPTAAKVDAQADAMKASGLAAAGFQYVNLDDFWYQCPGSQGPNVDANGRWVTDTTKFPASGSTDGIKAVADHVHADGLQFGLYVTPGVSQQAVAQNSAILGTSYHVKDIATTTAEKNYNCKGMVGIDYSKPGAQQFIDSWADEFASWGVDYVKIDGVGTPDVPDIQAWSKALVQTGRPIHLELSNNLAIGSAATWKQYSNGWRTSGDIECYTKCTTPGTLTDWTHVQTRFGQVASWQPDGGPGAFNDYDSLEVGNGSATGLTDAEQQSQMSLWALGSGPLILGTDLTQLNATELGYLKNRRVLAVDQDAIDASRIVDNGNQQVYSKKEKDGSVVIGLFNYSGTDSTTVSVPLSAAGISGSGTATDLWSGASLGSVSGTYSVNLGPGAVKLIRVVPSGSGGGGVTIEAEAAGNTLAGAARVATCAACSGGHKVGYIGNGAANSVTINGITEAAAGSHTLTIAYLVSGSRSFSISVNGGPDVVETVSGSSFATPASASVTVQLNAGANTIKFHNDTAYAPDLDAITVS
ncbi:alpha-galactosidase D [Catenulispora pinisilvae]|uniref:alpha-galactosidase D n=1 Tax=Catenulispora pinisilvae TaxID=2705253 RepID=UPI00189245C5|nr:alpha-galactosidase [Catenulispora pinisilvae]